MTFLEIVQLLITTAEQEPNINTVVREFTDLNREDIEYSAIVIQDRDGYRDYINNQDYITYSFYIGYVDVLAEKKVGGGPGYTTYDTRDHIVSTGVTVINDIINVINNSYYPQLELRVSDRINTFHQRFTAECAGVYMVVNANVPISDCVDSDVKLFDTLQAVVTSNGDYHWAPFGDGVAFNQVDITVDVSGDKPEESLVETISSNGSYHFDPSPGSVFSGADITVAVSGGGQKPEERLVQAISSNGSYHYDPSPGSVFSSADITVSVPVKEEVHLIESITENGEVHFTPESGKVYDWAEIEVDVHPSERFEAAIYQNGSIFNSNDWAGVEIYVDVHPSNTLIETISSNGVTTFSGEWDGAEIYVDVHPSVSLSETYTTNGTYSISGEFDGGVVTVAVSSDQKPEQVGNFEVTEWGTAETFYPDPGYVFSAVEITNNTRVKTYTSTVTSNGRLRWNVSDGEALVSGIDISVDVHPSSSLSETYTSNGTYSISGEYNGGAVTVAVPQKTEVICDRIINENGSFHYTPVSGEVFNDVHITTDVHPSVSLSETYTSNGTYNISGEYNGGTVTVAVSDAKPEESLVETISSNGSYHYDPSAGSVFSSADITVSVHPSQTLIETIAVNGTRNFTGEWNGAQITTDVHPSVSLVTTISSNGVTSLSGEWKDAEITVSVHPSTSLSATYTSNGTYTEVGEWSGATIAVSVPERKPEETLAETISSNGSYHFDPSAGSVFSGADITVSVPAPVTSSLSVNISSNGSYSYTAPSGQYYDSVAVDVSVPMTTTLTVTQAQYNNLSVKDLNTIYLIYG